MATPASIKKRPKHLDLMRIRLPVPGIVSILHRVSGATMFLLLIPLALLSLQESLRSPDGFAAVGQVLGNPLAKLIVLGFAWAFLHHFFAGVRYLLLDLHLGIALPATRFWSKAVLWVSGVLTLLVGLWLW